MKDIANDGHIEALDFPSGQTPTFVTDEVLTAFCKGIIDHIKANAVVTSTGGDPQGGTVNSTGAVT